MGAHARNFGRASVTLEDGKTHEYNTLTCAHCQRIVFVKPGTGSTVYLIWSQTQQQWREELGAFCRRCMAPICLRCEATGRCLPWERQLQHAEQRDRFRRSVSG